MKTTVALIVLALAVSANAQDGAWVERLAFWARPELRASARQLAEIDAELATLPVPAGMRSGNRIGFQTDRGKAGAEPWVEVVLPAVASADSVVLVPAVVKGATENRPGYGFPRRFTLEAFDDDGEAHLLLDETAGDFPNPGVNPVVARFPAMPVRRVRLTATEPWTDEGPAVLALAEVLILAGNRNVALGGRVNAVSSRENLPTWSRANLLDMNTPLGLPVAPLPASSLAPLGYHSAVSSSQESSKSVTVALPAAAALEEIRLVPARRSELPSWLAFGFPTRFTVELATDVTFRNARVISDVARKSVPSPGQNLVCLRADGQPAQFVRVTATRLAERTGDYVFALGEVQAYAGGKNVALGAAVIASDTLDEPEWKPAALTDGFGGGGRLLELPAWIRLLERRRALEAERAAVAAARLRTLDRAQRTLVGVSFGGTGAIGLLSAVQLWRLRRRRQQEQERLRERLARDLHDELGSNLGSIALISAFAAQPETTPEAMREDFAEIERVARESADSMRDMVALLSARVGGGRDWLTVLRGLAERLLRGVELDCALPAAPLPAIPDLATRRELYLFCKEVLHNAARHGRPQHVRFSVAPRADGLRVEIADDGAGFDPAARANGHGLGNLRERAATMHAQLDLQSNPGHGTTVRLDLPRTRHWAAE